MKHLNYSHLLYFWTVAREGSIAQASKVLHLTPQTISGQLKQLEDSIGHSLFERVGRGLVLSSTGQIVNQYADEIFTLGAELAQRVREQDVAASANLRVGVVNSIAKLITYRILEPVLSEHSDVRVICHEANLEPLLGELAIHQLDLVISDRTIPTGLNVRAYHHHLGDSALAIFAPEQAAAEYETQFPAALQGAPMLMPAQGGELRRHLDEWFDQRQLTPKVTAEFDDSALLKAFGEAGVGLFPAPVAIRSHVERMYRVRQVGLLEGLSENYYAISAERKLKHPAILAIIESARNRLFISPDGPDPER